MRKMPLALALGFACILFAREATVAIASAVWQVAKRDTMVPRFSKKQVPAPVEGR